MGNLRQKIYYHGVEEITIHKELFEHGEKTKENMELTIKGGEGVQKIEFWGIPGKPLKIKRLKTTDYRKVKK